ncbi:MAG: choloylglycine hydrolase family protein [Candidatus Babeliales bacterium]|nr:choloylglycine hydrolase family protein [Candidatus Babeliales bacterium]
MRIVKICSIFALLLINSLFACTGIFLKTKDGSYIHARTLEFGIDLKSNILFVPRDYDFTALTPKGRPDGLRWKSKYAAIGTNAVNAIDFVDGVNEVGLSGGLFYFPGFAKFEYIEPENYNNSLPMWQLLTWILTSFETVDEVKKALPSVLVSDAIFPGLNMDMPAHLTVHDLAGNSIVIEYLNGKLNIFDNPLGVITNSPNFDWHLTNLRNYINLSPIAAKDKMMSGIKFSPLGQGSGMLGVPGDFTPPSRFVRAVSFVQATPEIGSELEGVKSAFHILNNFDIPKGIAVDEQGYSDYTLWTSAIDTKNKIFYYRPYDNFQLQKIDLMQMDLNAKAPQLFSMKHDEEIIDVNNLLAV